MVCGKHSSTVPGVSSGLGIEGMWGWRGVGVMWGVGWREVSHVDSPQQMRQCHCAYQSTVVREATILPFPWCLLHLLDPLGLEDLLTQCTAFLGEQGSQNHSQGFGSTAVTLQRQTPPAQRMTHQCRKETRCWWNRPLPLLHPICAPCLSNNTQNRRKIWTPHSL